MALGNGGHNGQTGRADAHVRAGTQGRMLMLNRTHLKTRYGPETLIIRTGCY